jgi:DNA repair protein RecO (recombination protein O)
MLIKDLAICVRAIDYSETSQIVTFFTKEHGKIDAIAKGSKRPKSAFGGPLEIFYYGNIIFTDSDREKLATLTEFEPEYKNTAGTGLYKNIFILNCCFFAVELLTKLTDDYDPHHDLFESFLQFLRDASEQQDKTFMLSLLILFQLTLLKEVGLQVVLNHCANCKTKYTIRNTQHDYYFSTSANGLVCQDCEMSFPDKIRLSKQAYNCLTNLKLTANAQGSTLIEIEKILIHHFTSILGHLPKMAKCFL